MHNSTPSISVVMATFNGETFLKQQIDSILKQTFKNFELIICDDKSQDRTVEIIETYMKAYDCIKLYKNDVQLGIVKNFEKAIALAESQYIALSDQDDIWEYNKLEVLMKEIKNLEQLDSSIPLMVHSDLAMINEKDQMIRNSFFTFKQYDLKEGKNLSHIISRCGVMGNTILMNAHLKKCILPFPDDLDVHDYWIALVNELYGKRSTMFMPLVKYRIHKNNFSNSIDKFEKNTLKKTKQLFSMNFPLPYMNLGREKIVKLLLKDPKLSKNDREIIENFLLYLNFNTNRLSLFYILLKFDFVKKSFLYRLKLFVMIVFGRKIYE